MQKIVDPTRFFPYPGADLFSFLNFFMEDSVSTLGTGLVLLGAGFAAGLSTMGTGFGSGSAGEAAAGVVAERPNLFVKMLILQAMPGSQMIYGFVIAMLLLPLAAGASTTTGVGALGAGLAVGIAALGSGIAQGRVLAAGAGPVARDEGNLVKTIIFAAIVETAAIFGFLVAFLILNSLSAA